MNWRSFFAATALIVAGCASTGPQKLVLDASPNRPKWVDNNRLTWTEDGRVFFRSKENVRGDQRQSGCEDLASMENRERLLKGIADDVRGALDSAQTNISENAEMVLGKVRSGKWEGRIVGLRDEETYFERYQIRDEQSGEKTERIDCYLLSSISSPDYVATKRNVVNKVVEVDAGIKKAITQKQIDFFGNNEQRQVSSTSVPDKKAE